VFCRSPLNPFPPKARAPGVAVLENRPQPRPGGAAAGARRGQPLRRGRRALRERRGLLEQCARPPSLHVKTIWNARGPPRLTWLNLAPEKMHTVTTTGIRGRCRPGPGSAQGERAQGRWRCQPRGRRGGKEGRLPEERGGSHRKRQVRRGPGRAGRAAAARTGPVPYLQAQARRGPQSPQGRVTVARVHGVR